MCIGFAWNLCHTSVPQSGSAPASCKVFEQGFLIAIALSQSVIRGQQVVTADQANESTRFDCYARTQTCASHLTISQRTQLHRTDTQRRQIMSCSSATAAREAPGHGVVVAIIQRLDALRLLPPRQLGRVCAAEVPRGKLHQPLGIDCAHLHLIRNKVNTDRGAD